MFHVSVYYFLYVDSIGNRGSNNPIKLEQRIGRIIREHENKQRPLIVDFWLKGPIVGKQQKNRYEWYKRQNYDL